ncbi:hypothetical protein [Lysinibacillus sp. NPDC047702]|uniref:hypothetical protein n=1 Tax=unclassified Lysinibacillus TaxID=2636778 RepID=UPI003CFF2980
MTKQSTTTTELCEKVSDIPRITLYRNIKLLLDNNILTVVSEKKIGGALKEPWPCILKK